jgi:hypothetical protein
MTDDAVTLCRIVNDTNRAVETYYNTGKNRSSLIDEKNPSLGISNQAISLENGILTCSFRKLKSIADSYQYFDMRKEYYLLFGRGYVDDSGVPF